jgi:PAS domain S-box-containing protein
MTETIISPGLKKIIPWKMVLIFVLFTAAIILVGIYYYESQKSKIFTERENDLSVIATMKINQILTWRNERVEDARVISNDKPLIRSLEIFLNSGNKISKSELVNWMKSVRNEYDFTNVLIADTLFKIRLSVDPSDFFLGDSIKKEMKAGRSSHNIIMTDLHRSKEVHYIHIDILIPLFDSVGKNLLPVANIILRIDPKKVLFPLLQSWPTRSKSSETLLLRKEGDSVLYLNDLHYAENTALKLKLPLNNLTLLAAKAANGVEGVVEGMDYRNKAVVGSLHKIDGTNWFMVAKIDKEELLLPLKRYVMLIVILVVLLVLITASTFAFFIWDQRLKMFKLQLKDETAIRESEERFTTAFRMSPVSVTISSLTDNRFIDVNNTFLSDMEYKREEVIGHTPRELNIWGDEKERLWVINEIEEKSRIFGKVISYRSKTGKIIYGLSSMSVVKVNGEPCNLSTVVNITESKKAEIKLLESEELFRKLFENMLNGFAYCKMIMEEGQLPDFLYINVNEAFESLTGLKDVIGKRASEAIPGIQTADPELLKRYSRVALSGKPEVFETYVESLKMWFAISVYSPQKGYFVAVFDVITTRKLAEEKLHESRATLQSIIDNSNSLIYLVDTDGRFMMVNQPLEKLLSKSGEELIGHTREAFLPHEISDIHRKNDLEVIATGKTQIFEEENIEPDGKHSYLTTKFPLLNIQNEVYAVGGLSTDITERKQIEKTLKESEERFRSLYENVTIGIYRTTSDGRILMANPALVKMLGFDSFEQLASRNLGHEGYEPSYPRSKFLNKIEKEGKIIGLESAWTQKNGNTLFVRESAIAVRDSEGRMLYYDGTVEDITDRKKAEEALRESEDKFKYVFDHSVAGKSITFPSGEMHVNKAFCEMTGYSPEELANTRWQEISYPDDINLTERELQTLISGEKISTRFIKRYLHKNGEIVWADVGTALRRDENGKPLYFMTTAIDITERKLAVEALSESEERFSKSFKTSPISFMIANVDDGRIIEVNDAFTAISGYKREEALNSTTLNLKIWVNEQDRKQMIDSLRMGKAILNQETLLRAKGGNFATVLLSAQLIRLGNRNCIISSIEDITKRKEAEAEVRIQSEIMSHMAEAVYLVRMEDGIIVFTNSRFEELFGYGRGEMIGKHVSIVNAPTEKNPDQIAALIMNDLERKGHWAGEVLNIKKDGTVFWSHANVTIFDHSKFGKVLVSVQQDITDRKNAESLIRQLNEELEGRVIQRTEQLEAANKELEAFSYSVSHDLRAPLRAVHGFTKILLEDYEPKLDEEGKRICQIISSSATQMGGLIDDLLSFSRIGRGTLNPSFLNMRSIVREAFEEISSSDQISKINLKIGKLHKAFGDASLLRIVWNNLISNAIKYSSKEDISEIEISSRLKYDRITYSIQDNGVGFDMNYKHKLFGVFQRLHSEAEFEGNGVGLAIVQRIILKHGGKVWAEGEVGKGATFYFSLPVHEINKKTDDTRHTTQG